VKEKRVSEVKPLLFLLSLSNWLHFISHHFNNIRMLRVGIIFVNISLAVNVETAEMRHNHYFILFKKMEVWISVFSNVTPSPPINNYVPALKRIVIPPSSGSSSHRSYYPLTSERVGWSKRHNISENLNLQHRSRETYSVVPCDWNSDE
jgi:hypothetical protein